jgi:type VI secretion system protein VasI
MKKIVFILLLITSTGLYAADYIIDISNCTSIRSSIQRLACFDKLFDTPAYIEAINIPPALQPSYGVIDIIKQQENQRQADSYDLLINTSIEHAETKQQRVVLSAPAIGAIGIRPIFALSCIDNITRIQIILSQPLNATRTALSIQNEKGQQILSEQWKVIEGGYIVDAGRGIPSIQTAQRLKHSKRITLSSDQATLEGLVFDLEKLPQHINQLATACHWFGTPNPFGARHD